MSLLYARPTGLGEGSKLAPSVPLLQPLSDTKHSGIHELSFQLFEYSILLVTSTPLDILWALPSLHDPHTFMTDLSLFFGVSSRYFSRNLSWPFTSGFHVLPQCTVLLRHHLSHHAIVTACWYLPLKHASRNPRLSGSTVYPQDTERYLTPIRISINTVLND